MAPRGGGGGDGSVFLENLFLLGTTLGTLLVVTWIIFRIIGGIFRRCNDSLMVNQILFLAYLNVRLQP